MGLDAELVAELTKLSPWPTLRRATAFLVLYAGASLASVFAWTWADTHGQSWAYAALPLTVVVGAMSLHGISLFVHEGVHGVLSTTKMVNWALSVASAIPVMQSFTAYRVLHLSHHRGLGQPDDPDHYPNYSPRKPVVFAMYWGRLLGGYPAYIVMIPILGFRRAGARDRVHILLEALLTIGVWVAVFWLVPLELVVLAWALPMLVIHFVVNVRGMSQHTCLLETAEHPVASHVQSINQNDAGAEAARGQEENRAELYASRTFLTSSIVRFFMCNENYHLEHHLYPQVPWYGLRKLHLALKDDLVEAGAPLTPGYLSFVRDFVLASVFNQPTGTVHVERT